MTGAGFGGKVMVLVKWRVVVLCALLASGCSWQLVPAAPDLIVEARIPMRVGIVLGDNQATNIYGPGVVSAWKEMRLFETVVFPYRDGDPVDAILRLTIDGYWKGSGVGAGIVLGLTFGLAGPAIGPSMTGTHDVLAVVTTKSSDEIARYSALISSTVEWGLTADLNEVTKKAEELQRRRMAVELANKIRSDRANLLSGAGKQSKVLFWQLG